MDKGYGLDALSQAAHTIASWRCDGSPNWNVCYVAALQDMGFDLVPIAPDAVVGKDGPIQAPWPVPGPDEYPTPSVIAPKGWQLPTVKGN